MDFVCPKDASVWNAKGFTPCFENLVFGFGGEVVTVVTVLALAVAAQRSGQRNRHVSLSRVVILRTIPALGALVSTYQIFLLSKKSLEERGSEPHYWVYKCSQLISWMVVLLVSLMDYWFLVLCNRILCFWWILKPVLKVPQLLRNISSLEVIPCIIDSASVLVEITFAIFVCMTKVMCAPDDKREFEAVEDPLLLCNDDMKEGQRVDLGNNFHKWWDLLTFKFVDTMMDVGTRKQLDSGELVSLPCELMPSLCHNTLSSSWSDERTKHYSNPSLFRAIYNAYGSAYLRLGLLKALNDCLGFVGPLLLNRLIRFLQQGSIPRAGYGLALSLGFISILKSFLDTQYSFRLLKFKLMLRSSLMTLVYHKCLHTNLVECSKFSEGEVQNFMSVDADRVVNLCNSLHDAWSLPLQIVLALYFLYTQVRFAFVSGVTITVLLIPVNKWISTLIANATVKMMKEKDERIRSAAELLTYIRIIKMFSWENLFTKGLMEKREMEVKHLSTRKYLDAWCVFFWATTPTLFSLSTFGVFTSMGHSLDAATVFTCVALFNTLISPLNSFPWVINGLIDAIISTRRLSKYLSCREQSSLHRLSSDSKLQEHSLSSSFSDNSNPSAIIFQDACCTWSSTYQAEQGAVLSNISLGIPEGTFVAIIGEVGSGKSSLLNSILGEMEIVHGTIYSNGSVGYVPQVPWILSGSVRHNILLGNNFNSRRYAEVLQACTLDVDISIMVGGDLAYIGEKGVNLSGGQRARLALARAVYNDADIYLLDDVLSAVDSQVACWILQRTILGPLMNQKTRLLCTHNPQAISAADIIVVMERGRIKWAGTSSSFSMSPYSVISIPKESQFPLSPLFIKEGKCVSTELKPNSLFENDIIAASGAQEESSKIEVRKEGKVEFTIYKSYARFASWHVVIFICVSATLMQASRNGNDLWLSHWVDSTPGDTDIQFYLIILSIFGFMNSLLTLARAFSFSYGGLRAAVQVHSELLTKLVNAPISFFDQNPSGRILNRLSSDLYTIDDSLPFILNILLANFFGLLGIAAVLSYTQVIIVFLLLPMGYIYSKLQFYYRSTSRELRRLDSVSRSPIYSSFAETLDGSSTIRAFKKEEIFLAKFLEHVRLYQKTSYSESTASLWLSLRLQLLAAFLILFIAVMAVVGCNGDFPLNFGTPGLVGLSLSYAAPVVSLLSSFLTSFTETEKEMVSIERVVEYIDIPQEQLQGLRQLPDSWPVQGQIEFKHVTLKYRQSLPSALNDVSFSIAAGMQVGVVGRTGAGKSSVLNALFRLAPICTGHILVDGLDIADIAVRDLRGRFSVVPQNPFLFEGSLRENLDPSCTISDAIIWEALEKCHIKKEVQSAGGLDVHVKESGSLFSIGQKQLICLARAILKSSKILCLDECSANVDTQTALMLQNTISEVCKGVTVLTIAHRISTVLGMDMILVLDHGKLVEQGNPQDLLKDEFSRFSSFARACSM